ncbi:MAG: hypothetical protein Q4A28_09620 [Brachymonas sp.]|nr:hypothetical protein [Brachymonas sp.]
MPALFVELRLQLCTPMVRLPAGQRPLLQWATQAMNLCAAIRKGAATSAITQTKKQDAYILLFLKVFKSEAAVQMNPPSAQMA